MNSEYSFKDKWLGASCERDQLYYEILSFGTVDDLNRIPREDRSSIRDKMIRLSMVTYIFGQRQVSYSWLIRRYRDAGIELDSNDIEMILLELNDRGIVQILIDSAGETVDIVRLNQYRDVYCYEKELLLINPETLLTNLKLINTLEMYIQE